ncbi:cysteine desulfurase family protein [Ferviditalea candida]|uniref:cysteine desulfurase family protein n=1 Tax=Ferviditalea candida TaxID=3108399 RepID=UPI00352E13CD
MLYFDHSATTPPYDEVVEAFAEVMKKHYGNPSSLHHLGMEAERLVNRAREVIALSLGVKPAEIVFTSGGTESNNLAVKGIVNKYAHRGNHLITTMIEHPSVLRCFQELEKEGAQVTYLPVDRTGSVRLEDLQKSLTDETLLVSIMHVNNEMGRIQPIAEIGNWLKQYPRIVFHVDAVQSVGKIPINPGAWRIDMLTVSAHKIRGPKGIGFLYKREGLLLNPLLSGGGQENGLRSGTENVPAIVAMAKAVRMTMEQQSEHMRYMYGLRNKLTTILHSIPELVLNGSDRESDMAPQIVNVSFPGMKSEVVIHALESKGIMVSSQSACSSGEERPSRVLLAMGHPAERARSGIRISLSPMHTPKDIDLLGRAIREVVQELKQTMRLP